MNKMLASVAVWTAAVAVGPWCSTASAFDVCAKITGRGGNIKLRVPPCKSTEVKLGTYDGVTLQFEGINLQVVSGGGSTNTANGRGNIIVGYNGNTGGHPRGGSHNVVIGDEHTYSSYGGVVAGFGNTITGVYSSVTGGIGNDATGDYSVVSGGDNNTAVGPRSCVTAGRNNLASGQWSAVSGGRNNRAGCASPPCPDAPGGGSHSAISGGNNNIVTGGDAAISGGGANTATGDQASVHGGVLNTAGGGAASVSGGSSRSAPGNNDWVGGGLFQDF